MPDFPKIAIGWKKKGLNFGVTIFEADEQSLVCELNCAIDPTLFDEIRAALRYHNEVAPGVRFGVTAEAYSGSGNEPGGSRLSLEIRGGF